MKTLLIACLFGLLCHFAYAQDSVLKNNYYLKARVWETNQTVHLSYVADITETDVLLVDDPVKFRRSVLRSNAINYQQVNIIMLKRKGSIGRGLWKGALGGMVLGGIVGAITYKKCDQCWFDFGIGPNIAAGAIVGIGAGGLTGVIVGALAGKRFTINGNKNKFDQMRLSVLDMAYKKPN